ncbi:PIN domain-containing protein [Dyadobacter luticola]|uniref:PIN like domain-containing protein n=1 Tax=Dyadobacter luticola TaxID=1979387 RepID=A0A5R9KW63_9BACT|nr:PIN domain-containing protein [Dyadobacter luticola]TLV00317.1 hypothetical protein FEN17_12510 [Dyadobacter luticola]
MRALFHEHFRKPEQHYKDLWRDAVFCLDTNILLNLYRYSDGTREQLIDILTKMQGRLWVPYWVGKEFFKNRLPIISEQISSYKEPLNNLSSVQKAFENDRKHPFLSVELLKDLGELIKKINAEIESAKDSLAARISHDQILDQIAEIVGDSMGTPPTDIELKNYLELGEKRLSANVPPGFKDWVDKKNDRPKDPFAGFGDFIIWQELIKKAKEDQTPIIFISDDQKEDWILIQSGLKQGPLPALHKEFYEKTGQYFHMYTAQQFVKLFQSTSGEKVSETVYQELKIFEITPTYTDEAIDYLHLRSPDLSPAEQRSLNSQPRFEVLTRTGSETCHWQFVIPEDQVLFRSLKIFDNLDKCLAGINGIKEFIKSPNRMQLVSPFTGKFTLTIRAEDQSVLCETFLSWEDPTFVRELIPKIIYWMINAKVLLP